MSEDANELFDDFVSRYRRGEDPDLRAYLVRAGDDAEEFGALVEVALRAVPPPAPSDEAVALARAWVDGQPPLLELRVRRGMKRDDVVDFLRGRLGLEADQREKLGLRYHELETGQLEPARVDRRVWDALATALRAQVEDLTAWARPVGRLEAQPLFRLEDPDVTYSISREEPAPADEVDQLFGVS